MPFLVTVRLYAALRADPGAVDQDVETAEAVDDAGHRRSHGGVVSDVSFGVIDAIRGSRHVEDGYLGPLGRQ